MKSLLNIIAVLALFGTIVPSLMVFSGTMDLETCKNIMSISAILWLICGWSLMDKLTREQEQEQN